MDKIVILDFGSQTTQLISRRIREIGIYSEVFPGEIKLSDLDMTDVKGIILSGSPDSVYDDDAPQIDKAFYETGLPVLGICFGLQRITTDFSGSVKSLEKKEYGRSAVNFITNSDLFNGVPENFISWMSHGDSIEKPGKGFKIIAESEHHTAAVFNSEKKIYGIQFHPEVSHCEYGSRILENFASLICCADKDWNMDIYFEQTKKKNYRPGSWKRCPSPYFRRCRLSCCSSTTS